MMSSSKYPSNWKRYDREIYLIRYFTLLVTLIAFVIAWRVLNINYGFILDAYPPMADLFSRMYPPEVGYTTEIVSPMLETVNISILGTILALLLAIPVAYLGAANTTPNRATLALGKFIISATRSVNVIIWALIFVVVFGPGSLAGVMAVGIRSVGFCAKLISESIEEIDPGQIEAIRATGANGIQELIYGVVAQIKPAFVGVAVYRWDINIRASTVLGLVGAGGIGQELQRAINSFQWDQVLTILLVILCLVAISEGISAYSRSKVS
jgi:phosphonate transport system permease protein